MSALSASASRVRPTPVTVAVALSLLIVVGNLISPALPSGSGDDKVPTFVVVLGVILGVIGILAAVGLWTLRRWGSILTVVISAINLLSAAPGVAFGPYAWIKVLAALTVLVSALIIVLTLLPDARRAYS